MVIFNRLMAVLFAIAFVIVAPIGAVAFNVDKNVLSEPVWQRAIETTNFADGMREVVVSQMRGGPDSPLATLPEDDRRQLAHTLLPDETLNPVLDEFVTQWVAYGRAERDNISISTATITEGVVERFPAAVLALIETKPVCESPESYGSFTCRPRPEDQAEFERRLHASMEGAEAEMMQNSLVQPLGERDAETIEIHRTLIAAMKVAPYVALGLIALVAFFSVRGVRGLLLWVGVPLMVAGALVIGCALLGNLMLQEMLNAVPQDSSRPENDAVRPLFEVVFGDFVKNFTVWGAISAVTGFGMTIGGSFMPRAESSDAA